MHHGRTVASLEFKVGLRSAIHEVVMHSTGVRMLKVPKYLQFYECVAFSDVSALDRAHERRRAVPPELIHASTA